MHSISSLKNDKILIFLDFFVLGCFAALTFYVVLNHEPWRDEALSWLIVKNSTLSSLLFEHIRYQCHPMLWYVILYPFAKLGLPYFSQFVINWLLAVGVVYLILRRSPFSWVTRYAFVFSYLMCFQYTVLARNYALSSLIFLLIATFYNQRFRHPVFYALLVALLFNTHYLLFAAAGVLLLLYGWEAWAEGGIKVSLPIGIMLAGAAIALLLGANVPADHFYRQYDHAPNWENVSHVTQYMLLPNNRDISGFLLVRLGLAVLIAMTFSLIKRPKLLLIFLASLGWMYYIFVFHFRGGGPLHYGLAMILILFILWLKSCYPEERGFRFLKFDCDKIPTDILHKFVIITITCCFLISIRTTVWAIELENRSLYSGSKKVAEVIDGVYPNEDRIIVVWKGSYGAPVAVYLPERKFWYADSRQFATYWLNTKEEYLNFDLKQTDVITRAGVKFRNLEKVLFLFTEPLKFENGFGHTFHLIYDVNDSVWGSDESYYLYSAEPKR